MDPLWIIVLIVVAVVFGICVYLFAECLEGWFAKDRRQSNMSTSDSSTYIIGSNFGDFSDDPEAQVTYLPPEKERKPNPIDGLFCHLQSGTQSHHAKGHCKHGGGAWGTRVSVSGRAAGTNIWSPVSGGIYDSCQCEDNGGLH